MIRAWITLKEKSEIKDLFRKGKRKTDRNLSIFYRKNSERFSRILFCADKSSRISVQRNRVKRVLRALSRDREIVFPASHDIALIGSLAFCKTKYLERKVILTHLLKHVHNQ